jgi:hypothetical protein
MSFNGKLPDLPEPTQKQSFFCNKCGSHGEGRGWPHQRRDGSECAYMASSSGPFFTEDQVYAYTLGALNQILDVRLEEAIAEFEKGCSNTIGGRPEECPECVRAFVDAIKHIARAD